MKNRISEELEPRPALWQVRGPSSAQRTCRRVIGPSGSFAPMLTGLRCRYRCV